MEFNIYISKMYDNNSITVESREMEVFSLGRKEKVVIGRVHGGGLLGNRIVGLLDCG